MKKILVIQSAFIGDVILATAIPASLVAYDHSFQVDFLANKSFASVLSDNPYIRKIFAWDKSAKYKNLLACVRQIRKGKYDLVLNCHRFASSGFITVRSRAKLMVGFNKNPLSFLFDIKVEHSFNSHEIERNHKLLQAVFPDIVLQKPFITPEYVDFSALGIHDRFICIAPGSVWETKRFPIEKWQDFIHQLPYDLQIIAIGGHQDSDLVDKIFDDSKLNHLNLCGKISLRQSAMIMKKAIMNYANDSAPTHLASAVNAPVATIFCSTVPAFGFSPLSSVSHIIEIQENLHCRPCGIHGHRICPEGHFKCGFNIKTEQLLKILDHEQSSLSK